TLDRDSFLYVLFYFNAPSPSQIYTLSLHDALPIYACGFTSLCGVPHRYADHIVTRGSTSLRGGSTQLRATHRYAGFHIVPMCCRSEEHTSELQSLRHLVCRLLLEKKNKIKV